MAFGPALGLKIVDALETEPALRGYHLLPSVRGDLLWKLGRLSEARVAFERAAALARTHAIASSYTPAPRVVDETTAKLVGHGRPSARNRLATARTSVRSVR